MYDCEKYYNSLELNAVLKLLSNEGTMTSAKELALNLRPFSSFNTVIE